MTSRMAAARITGIVSSHTAAAGRPRGLSLIRVDELAAFVFAVVTELQVWLSAGISGRPAASTAGLVLAAAVAVRRRWPLASVLGGAAAVAADAMFGGALARHVVVAIPAAILLFYGAGAFLGARRARAGLILGVLLLLIQVLRTPDTMSDLFFEPVILAFLPWACGRAMRARSHRAQAARELAERLDAAQEDRASTAAEAERARIARELHDVIGHCLSVIVLQSGGARMLLGSQPERAEGAMRVVERAGAEALAEIRRLLGIFGESDTGCAVAPLPGIADIDALVAGTRAAGLATDLSIEGTAVAVPPALGLSAYRIVQESLTNAIKHARASQASVHVRWAADQLHLEIADDGCGPAGGAGVGLGIVGMKERAALHGAALQAGARTGGGYLVRAALSLSGEREP
jgi:signal transduction histidine kinase